MKMTLTKLKALNQKNGGYFFDKDAMKAFGDTMKNLGIRSSSLGDGYVEVYRKNSPAGSWVFYESSGRVSHRNRATST